MTRAYIRGLLSDLGMSEEDMSGLLAKGPVERTRRLISMFSARQNNSEKLNVIFALGCIGDVELTGDFYADVLQTGNGWLKFGATFQGRMQKFNGHSRLREALENHLQGLSPVDALIRDAFPNGYTCPLK